jgi:hypothetical protein
VSAKREKIKKRQLQGFKYFKAISGMLDSLHNAVCKRDRAGNRKLNMDQYIVKSVDTMPGKKKCNF